MTVGAVRRDAETAEFFDGTARGEFLLRRCADCGTLGEPDIRRCRGCESVRLGWAPAAGGASVVSWAVVNGRVGTDGPAARTVVAIAELDEGPWWWGQVLDADPVTIAAGQRLTISFEPAEGQEVVPAFRLA